VTTHRIAILGGDGIGPEVVAQGLKVLDVVEKTHDFDTERVEFDLGGRRYLATGEVLSDETLDDLRGFDAIYLGAVGTPDVPPGVIERGLLLKLRFAFDQFVNLRPVKLYPGVTSPIAGLTPTAATSSSSARTPSRSTPARAGPCTAAPRTRSPPRSRSTPATASSGSSGTRSTSPPDATAAT
jgi:hypothetical protein